MTLRAVMRRFGGNGNRVGGTASAARRRASAGCDARTIAQGRSRPTTSASATTGSARALASPCLQAVIAAVDGTGDVDGQQQRRLAGRSAGQAGQASTQPRGAGCGSAWCQGAPSCEFGHGDAEPAVVRKVQVSVARYLRTPPYAAKPKDLVLVLRAAYAASAIPEHGCHWQL